MKIKDFYCPKCCCFKNKRDVSIKYDNKCLAHGFKEAEYYFCNRCGCKVYESQKIIEQLIISYPWKEIELFKVTE